MMEFGIDSFAAVPPEAKTPEDYMKAMDELLERIILADKVGIDVFGLGEHHRKDFMDSAAHMILAAAASRTKNIKLSSAVTVLSTADPVRVFQNFATLDLISKGRAEIIAGRGSFVDAFPLFGYELSEYTALYEEKLELLLKIRDTQPVTWSGNYRPALTNQYIFPRPVQKKMPIWRGVGGTPGSFIRAGQLGVPLMVAIIGGETSRFRPSIEAYKQAWEKTGHPVGKEVVGIHAIGFLAETTQEAITAFFPGLKHIFDEIGKERGFPPMTMDRFLWQNSTRGAYLVGNPAEVAEKIIIHSEALGGLSRFTFQMDVPGLPHDVYLKSIELLGKEVIPRVREKLEEQ